MSLSAKGQQQKYVRQLQCQEQCMGHIAYYLSGLSRAYFFPTTFLEIAVYIAILRKAVGKMCTRQSRRLINNYSTRARWI